MLNYLGIFKSELDEKLCWSTSKRSNVLYGVLIDGKNSSWDSPVYQDSITIQIGSMIRHISNLQRIRSILDRENLYNLKLHEALISTGHFKKEGDASFPVSASDPLL